MENYSIINFCFDFAKAYFCNAQILTLIVILLLGIGVNIRLKKIEKTMGGQNGSLTGERHEK